MTNIPTKQQKLRSLLLMVQESIKKEKDQEVRSGEQATVETDDARSAGDVCLTTG